MLNQEHHELQVQSSHNPTVENFRCAFPGVYVSVTEGKSPICSRMVPCGRGAVRRRTVLQGLRHQRRGPTAVTMGPRPPTPALWVIPYPWEGSVARKLHLCSGANAGTQNLRGRLQKDSTCVHILCYIRDKQQGFRSVKEQGWNRREWL